MGPARWPCRDAPVVVHQADSLGNGDLVTFRLLDRSHASRIAQTRVATPDAVSKASLLLAAGPRPRSDHRSGTNSDENGTSATAAEPAGWPLLPPAGERGAESFGKVDR